MNRLFQFLSGLFIFLTSCAGMSTEHLVGNYYLIKMDYADENLEVSYKLEDENYVGVVGPIVFAVGFNDEFIIVKQHPTNFGDTINRSITDYYIIPLKFKVHDWPDENKIGPMTYKQFLMKREDLNIPDELDFSEVFKKLE